MTTIVAPSGERAVAAGSDAEVFAIFLNTANVVSTLEIARSIPATVRSSDRAIGVVLRRTDLVADRREVAPGAFVRVRYALPVPADVVGPIAVVSPLAPGSAASLMVAAPSGMASAGPPVPSSAAALTQPLPPLLDEDVHHTGFVEYFGLHFFPHEPMYFLVGPEDPAGKFQISFKYKILNDDGAIARAVPPLAGLYLGYSQTSFWDLTGESKPFFDNSYRPEMLFSYDDVLPKGWKVPGASRVGLQFGVLHESNGRDGAESRSLNIAYVRPIFVFGDESNFFVTVAPRAYVYLGSLDDNPDIKDYRGYADLRLTTGWAGGLQFGAVGRLGDDWDKGSLELDMSYPLRAASRGNFDVFLYAQFFTGYGESLLGYKDADNTFRLGLSIVR